MSLLRLFCRYRHHLLRQRVFYPSSSPTLQSAVSLLHDYSRYFCHNVMMTWHEFPSQRSTYYAQSFWLWPIIVCSTNAPFLRILLAVVPQDCRQGDRPTHRRKNLGRLRNSRLVIKNLYQKEYHLHIVPTRQWIVTCLHRQEQSKDVQQSWNVICVHLSKYEQQTVPLECFHLECLHQESHQSRQFVCSHDYRNPEHIFRL